MKYILLILQLIGTWPLTVFCADTYRFSLTVNSRETHAVLQGAVASFPSKRSAVTGSDGKLSTVLQAGINRMIITCEGFQTFDTLIDLTSDQHLNVFLSSKVNMLEAVSYRSVKGKGNQSKVNSTDIGKLELSTTQLRKVPVIGGEPDLVKALQLTPGIKRGTEGGVGMYVRGGGADQNLVMLDEAVIYNAGHLLGFFSVFNSNAIGDMSVYKSGFPAMYGGRLSSVLDIRTREGNMKKTVIEGTVGTVSSGLTVQGPIQKNKSSFIISARRSYIDQAFRMVGKELPMYFYDLNARLSFKLGKYGQLSYSTYYGRDVLDWNGKVKIKDSTGQFSQFNHMDIQTKSDLGNYTNTLKWSHGMPGNRSSYAVALVHSSFQYTIDGKFAGNELYVRSSIRDLGVKADLAYRLSPITRLKYGLSITNRVFKPHMLASAGSISDVKKSQEPLRKEHLEYGAYIQSETSFSKRLSGNYGLRFSALTASKGKIFKGLEPRMNIRYMLDSSSSLKASYTRMRQYMHLVSSSSMAMPTDLWYPATGKAVPEVSDQVTLGYYSTLRTKRVYFSTEVYYKSLQNIIEFREGTTLALNDQFEQDLLLGKGRAYGAEVFINYTGPRLSGWVGYTLSWSDRQFDSINRGQRYFSKYDRRHDISLVGNYKLSNRWSVSASWVFATGNPFTAKTGQYIAVSPGQNQLITQAIYGSRNDHRFSSSHRLDLDICYKFKAVKKMEVEIHGSLYNVYNRTQPSRVEVVKDEQGNYKFRQKGLFGMIPALSCNFKF